MKLNTKVRYSLRLMQALAQFGADEAPVNLAHLADSTGISRKYLDQLIIPLRRAGLVRGKSGREGGYCLVRAPDEITLEEIVEASDGPVALTDCVDEPRVCARSPGCHCRKLWNHITARIREVLDEYTLADFAEAEWQPGEPRGGRRAHASGSPS
jgi:Rrf2 family protein